MKGLQILASLLLLAAFCKADEKSEKVAQKVRELGMECAKESDLTEDDVNKIPSMICNKEELDDKQKKQIACFYNKLRADEELGKELEELKDRKELKVLKTKLEECNGTAEGGPVTEEKAVEVTECLMANTEMCKEPQ